MDLVCRWLTGPDCGAEQRLAWHPGEDGTTVRVVIGRAGPFRCDDPSLLAHHVVVEARAQLSPHDGAPTSVALTAMQLAGTDQVRTDRAPVVGRTSIEQGERLFVGSSSCSLHVETSSPPSTAVRAAAHTVVRQPRPVPAVHDLISIAHLRRSLGAEVPQPSSAAPEAAEPDAPDRERPGGLIPTLIGLAGSAAVAVITGRPMFLLFGAVGSLVAVSSWVAQWLAFGRRHRRSLESHRHTVARRAARRAAARADDHALLERVTPSLLAARAAIETRSMALWACRRSDSDAFLVCLGIGDVRTADATITGVPVPASLGPGERIAVHGPLAAAVARSLVVQLAARCGPADLRLVVDVDGWEWADRLPHALRTEGAIDVDELTGVLGRPAAAHLVVVTDRIHSLADPSSPLRQVLDRTPAALVAVCERAKTPSCATSALDTAHRPSRFVPDVRGAPEALEVEPAGLGARNANLDAVALGMLRDPEVLADSARHLPVEVELDELEGVACGPEAITARWLAADMSLRTGLGVMRGSDGRLTTFELDLVADGPHALVAGTTGSGKSELLRTLVIGLARSASPRHLSFVLVDYKGGAAFDAIGSLPHVAGVVTDLDDRLAERMLRSLHAEIRRREEVFRGLGIADLSDAWCRADEVPPRLVIVVDEFAALVAERPGFLHALVGIAQRGRSLGLHLVLATQRPAGVVSDDIRANTALRISLRLHDRADALDVVGDDGPLSFPRRAPGRALVRDGERCTVVQTARCTRLGSAVEDIRLAAATCGTGIAVPPWLPPLPDRLDRLPDSIGATLHPREGSIVAGVVDDPDRQRYAPLQIPASPVSMVVAGSRGSGVSSTLATIVRLSADPTTTAIVLDTGSTSAVGTGADDPWQPLVDEGVVLRLRPDDDRLLQLTRHVLTARRDGPGRLLVAIDEFDAVRRALSNPAHDHRPEHRHETRLDQLLDSLLQAHDDIDLLLGTGEPSTLPPALLARCDTRWVHHLADSSAAAALGVPARLVPPPVPGRLVVDGNDAQVLLPASSSSRTTAAEPTGAPLLAAVPARIEHAALPPAVADRHHVDAVVGIDLETGRPARLAVSHGEHVLVIGPRRTGRTFAVALLAHQLRSAGLSVLAVDDVDRHDDLGASAPDGDPLGAVPHDHAPTCVLSATGDALRLRHGWWTTIARRIRCGVVLAGPDSSADGESLGVSLPRGFPVATRPGRGWLVDHGVVTPVQLAVGPFHPSPRDETDDGLSTTRH